MKTGADHGHWAALEETGILWGMRFMLLIYRLFGRLVFRIFLHPIVSYYFLTGRAARDASREYLSRLGHCYPELGIQGSLWDSYRHFLSLRRKPPGKDHRLAGKLEPRAGGISQPPVAGGHAGPG